MVARLTSADAKVERVFKTKYKCPACGASMWLMREIPPNNCVREGTVIEFHTHCKECGFPITSLDKTDTMSYVEKKTDDGIIVTQS